MNYLEIGKRRWTGPLATVIALFICVGIGLSVLAVAAFVSSFFK